ncbi:MAG: arsenite/tail-anchored protein-transporting ATPase [Clostridiales bacterium]|nr:arsenite/tail-anchored protein-transporting ATPase [Clostridiales bacterium]
MRIILYTGKGGVGKTTIAAATACKIAKEGKRVLVMSTDAAHSLGDSFGVTLGKEATRVKENLYAMELDTVYESEKAWGNLKAYMKETLTSNAKDGIEVEELLVFPGLEELFSMFSVQSIYESGAFDVLVVDCAPTGETLSFLKYPERLSTLMEKALPIKRKGAKLAGPAVEKLMKIPMPKDNVFDDLEYLMDRMQRLKRLLNDKEVVSLRIVTTPEKIVIAESKRNYTCLSLYDYNVDAIIVNRVYPKEAMEGYFHEWAFQQEESLRQIKESFYSIPVFTLALQNKEVCELSFLENIGEMLYEERDPYQVFCKEEIFLLRRVNEGLCLSIYFPLANKEELSLSQEGEEIVLGVRNEYRRILLPKEVVGLSIIRAKQEEGRLNLYFAS